MELIKLGNTVSTPVKSCNELEAPARELLAFVDEKNGKIEGMYDAGYAFSHAQVCENPLAFFVIAKEWVIGTAPEDMPTSALFKHRVIANPRIVEIPSHTVKLIDVENPATLEKGKEKAKIPNSMRLLEGCMSFPHKKAKNVERFYEVTVEYQIPVKTLGINRLKTVRETVKGLKAHIFQHEIDHMQGKNIYYGDRVR